MSYKKLYKYFYFLMFKRVLLMIIWVFSVEQIGIIAKYWHIIYQIEALGKTNPTPPKSPWSEVWRASNRRRKLAARNPINSLSQVKSKPSQVKPLSRVQAEPTSRFDRAVNLTVVSLTIDFQQLTLTEVWLFDRNPS